MSEPSDTSVQQRVLVGDSVYEDATLTIHDGHLFIEFDSDDLDSVTVDLRALDRADPRIAHAAVGTAYQAIERGDLDATRAALIRATEVLDQIVG